MSDIEYRIAASLDTSGDFDSKLPSASKLASIDNSFSKITSSMIGAAGSVANLFNTAVEKALSLTYTASKIGAGLAVAGAAFGVSFNAELEQIKIGLGSTMQAFGIVGNMHEGLSAATDLTSKMLQDVKTLPITFREFAGMMQNLAAPVFLGGGTANQLEEFVKKSSIFGAIALKDKSPDEVAASMSQVLSGRITNANPVVRALGIIGPEAEKMRGMDPGKRFEELNKLLDRYSGANEVFAHSFKAVSTTLKDNLILFAGKTTAPLFEAIKKDIVKINDWFTSHQSTVNSWAEFFGGKLVQAWHKGIEIAQEWFPIIWDFALKTGDKIAEVWKSIKPIVVEIADHIKAMLSDSGGATGKLGSILAMYAFSKIGGGVLSTAAGGGAMAIPAAAVGTAAASLAIAFASMEYAIGKSDTAARHWISTQENVSKAWDKLTGAFDDTSPFTKLIEMYGTFVATMSDFWSGVLNSIADVFKYVSDKYKEFEHIIHPFSDADVGPDAEGDWRKNKFGVDSIRNNRWMEPSHMWGTAVALADQLNKRGNMNINGGGGTHIGKVVIEVYQAGDPSRVARAVMDKMVDLQRYPKASPFVPNYSSSRTR